jgi:tRNA1Val (adenine37-N6)-methyltransferase
MKVGTDGVLLGAWANVDDTTTVLDIGSGTGLISLMIAQRNPQARITAIDIDSEAIGQTEINIRNSPFADRIKYEHTSIQDFANICTDRFDLIISNPPFFNRSLKSPDEQRSLARHTDTLPVDTLISLSAQLLSGKGRIALIYPYEYKDLLIETARRNDLYCNRITNVYPTPWSSPKRILMEMRKDTATSMTESNLVIETERHIYSEDFIELVRDFYLKM